LDHAISAAVEFMSLQGSVDKMTKPLDDERELTRPLNAISSTSVASLRPTNLKTDCSLDELKQMMSSLFDQKFEQKFQEMTDSYNKKTYGTQFRPNNPSRFYQNTGIDRPSMRRSNSPMRNYSNAYPHNQAVNHKYGSTTNTNYNSQSRNHQNMTQGNSFYEKPNFKDIQCTYCHKKGHIESRCYAKRNALNQGN
jgi:hypothetical protein